METQGRWSCPGAPGSPPAAPYLGAFVQEGVPDLEEDIANEAVGKDHEEPVKGDEGEVHAELPQVGHQPGQLLREEVLEHPLVHLAADEGACQLLPGERADSFPSCPQYLATQSWSLRVGPALCPRMRGAEMGGSEGAQAAWLGEGTAAVHSLLPGWSAALPGGLCGMARCSGPFVL